MTSAGPLGPVVEELTKGGTLATAAAHLDPDLRQDSVPRPCNWRPLFGQGGAAESHLRAEGIGPGDLFLFFGWFRDVLSNPWRFRPKAKHRHVLFGWLQVAERIDAASACAPGWACEHPHLIGRPYAGVDSVYVSTEWLDVPGLPPGLPGAGLFPRLAPTLVLTAPGQSRSIWRLPEGFADSRGVCRLSYHRQRMCRPLTSGSVEIRAVARGQEFVVDSTGLEPWLRQVFAAATSASVEA